MVLQVMRMPALLKKEQKKKKKVLLYYDSLETWSVTSSFSLVDRYMKCHLLLDWMNSRLAYHRKTMRWMKYPALLVLLLLVDVLVVDVLVSLAPLLL